MLSKSSNPFFAVLSCPMCPIHVHWWDTSDRIGQRGQDRTIWRAFGGYFVCPKASIANNHCLNNGLCLERSFCFHKSGFVGRSDLVSDPCPILSTRRSIRVGALFSKKKVGIENLKNWSCGMIKDKENCIVKSSRSQTSRALSLTRQTIILSDLRL